MAVPVITARALAGMPELIERECGSRALQVTLQECGLPLELLDEPRFFIPQQSLKKFVAAGSRRLGERDLGLVAAPILSVRDYGIWGDYVLAGATLGDALRRTQAALCYHSTHDRVEVISQKDDLMFSYRFAASHGPDYDNIAFIALAVMLSIVRGYLGVQWTPRFAELNIKPRGSTSDIEQTFGCETRLGAREVAFPIPAEALSRSRLRTPVLEPTIADIRQERLGLPPQELVTVVAEIVRVQLTHGPPNLDQAARVLDCGPRTLQRRLERRGLGFREIANKVKVERAKALLWEADLSVSRVAAELSYSSVANFGRAFSRETDMTPTQYRNRQLEAFLGSGQAENTVE